MRPGWREQQRRVNGVELHVVEAGDPRGPLVILCHGFPEFWWAWRHQIDPLADAGFRVLVPDLRGYNRSAAPASRAAYHLDTLAADIAELAAAYGVDRFRLVGHDWGAVIAWWVAARYPARVERLVILDGPHPDTLRQQVLAHPTQALRSLYVALFQLPRVPERLLSAFGFAALRAGMTRSARPGAFEPGALDRYADAWAQPGRLTAMLNYYRALRLRRASRAPARIAPPTLVLWGEHDAFLGRHVAEAGLALCDRGQLTIVDGTSHWLHLERPERVSAEILGFIREAAGGASGTTA